MGAIAYITTRIVVQNGKIYLPGLHGSDVQTNFIASQLKTMFQMKGRPRNNVCKCDTIKCVWSSNPWSAGKYRSLNCGGLPKLFAAAPIYTFLLFPARCTLYS